MVRAFLVSVLGTGLSRVLGAARDIALGHVLGAGRVSDAFWIAFTVPNIFRRFVADEGLTGALIPALARAGRDEGEAAARRLGGQALAGLLLAGLVLGALGILAAKPLVLAFAWGFRDDPEQLALAVRLTRILFPFVVFVSLVSWAEGMLNQRGHFFVPKVAPGLVSAAMVAAAVLAAGSDRAVLAIAWGVLVGGAVHLLVCLPPLVRLWGPVPPVFAGLREPRFRAFLREMSKVVAIGVFAQVNIMVLRQLASLLEAGSVTHYWYANRVVDLAQGAIAVAVGSAVLPAIARDVAHRDWDRFRADFSQAIRLAALFLLPAAVLLLVLAEPVVAVLFRHGRFGAADAEVTAATLRAMVPFMLAVAGINIVKRAFFALDERNVLLAVGGAGIALTAGAGYPLAHRLGVQGLALALSASTAAQLLAYLVLLRRRIGDALDLAGVSGPLLRMFLAALPAAALARALTAPGAWAEGPSVPNLLRLALAGAGAGAAYLAAAWLLRVDEARRLLRRLRRPRR